MQKIVYDMIFMERPFCRCLLVQAKKHYVENLVTCILLQFVGCYTQIYNGKGSVGLKITKEMVGHKFREFISARKPFSSQKKASPSKTKVKPKEKV
jgi:small subunit ribosomal protein S19